MFMSNGLTGQQLNLKQLKQLHVHNFIYMHMHTHTHTYIHTHKETMKRQTVNGAEFVTMESQ